MKQEFVRKFIKKAEKYLKTDLRYLLRGGVYMTIEYIVSVILGVSFGFLVANLLNPTEYGNYKYILSVGGIIGSFTFTGLSASLMQSIARGFDGAFRAIGTTQFKWSIFSLIIGISIGGYYLSQEAFTLGFSIIVVTILIPLRDFGSLSDAYLSGKELFHLKAKFNIIRNFVTTALLAIAVILFPKAHVMVPLQYLLEAISFLIILYVVLKSYPLKNKLVSNEVSLGKHLSYVDIIQRLFGQFDKVFIFQFLGATALASYSIALMPVVQLMSLSKITRALIAPRFSKRSFKEIHANIFHKSLIMFLASVVIMLVYILLAPYLYKYLLPQYTEMIEMAQVASLALLFTPVTLFGQVLVAQGCKKQLYIGTLAGSILLVGCVSLGGIFYGIFGALVGFIVSRAAYFIIGVLAYYHAYNEYLSSLPKPS